MAIRSVTIERFRGLERLEWRPANGLNCLVGPGDSGKSTALAAVSLALSPRPSPTASEYDYFNRDVASGFRIEVVLGDLDRSITDSLRVPLLQGWQGDRLSALPDEDDAEPVLVARVSGSPDLEVVHEIVGPDDAESISFPVSVRGRFRLANIASGGRAMRELSLGRGSLLEHHLGEVDMRGPMSSAVAAASTNLELPADAEEALIALRGLFAESGLPPDLHLGIVTPRERSLLGLLGLLHGEGIDSAIPLAFAGSGTRQLALFRLAAALIGDCPILVLDEPEAGLEPYRQRRLLADLRAAVGDRGQAFITTHSPNVLGALRPGEISRLAKGEPPVSIDGPGMAKVLQEAPSAFLCKYPVLCEGPTEAGLLEALWPPLAAEDGLGDLDAAGIELVSRGGQPEVLVEAEGLLAAGIRCGLFVDAEDAHAGRRESLEGNDLCSYGSWDEVKNVEAAVAAYMPFAQLDRVLDLAVDLGRKRRDSLLQQVGSKAGRDGVASIDDLRESIGESETRTAIGEAMDKRGWFKSRSRGQALGSLLLDCGLPPEIESVIRGLWSRVRSALT